LEREGEVLTGMREVSVSEFAKAHAAGAAVIDVGDVGDVEEYNRGHIPGAVSIPVQDMSRDLTAALRQIRRDAPVYVVCAAGNRSLIATGMLMHAGYDAYSVYGGTTGWGRAGHPVVGGDHVRH
jgi:rhodanese-related sulfurtransferase